VRIPPKQREELSELYKAKREATEIWNEAAKSVAERLNVKPGTLKKRIKYDVEGGLDKAAEEMQLLLEL
jgi:Fe-S cluster assembly ATPase SufC